MNTKIFISYSSKDTNIANTIYKMLTKIGIECFLDQKDIEWGESITSKVQNGLRNCSALIVILTPATLKSQWVPFEIGQATALGKKVLPFLTHPDLDVPGFMKDLNYKKSLNDIRTYFQQVYISNQTLTSEASEPEKVTPKQRDVIREERNKTVIEAIKIQEGITNCFVLQLEDHSDKGYLINVDFDGRQCAADVLSLIRKAFDECFPDVPIWGEMKIESENSVAFAYTYIDKYNKLLGQK